MFLLTIDCWNKIFDYLSLKDLHSLGQTCKELQKTAGNYYQLNHSAAEKFCGRDGIYTFYSDNERVFNSPTQTFGFHPFITGIKTNCDKIDVFHSKSVEFESITHIHLTDMIIDDTVVSSLKKILPNICSLQVMNCRICQSAYNDLLKSCKNLKRLIVERSKFDTYYVRCESSDSDSDDYDSDDFDDESDEYESEDDTFYGNRYQYKHRWLLQDYPNLEHLQLIPSAKSEIHGFQAFLERHSNIQCFSTTCRFIHENHAQLLYSSVQLDTLHIQIDNFLLNMESVCELIRQLHERGFYKRLHLSVFVVDQEDCDRVVALPGLERLCVKLFTECFSLGELSDLKEFAILDGSNPIDMELLAEQFESLEILYMENATFDDIMPFIRKAPNLRKIKVFFKFDAESNGEVFDLVKWNIERGFLEEAQKCTIYVRDNHFLATKWACRDGNLDFDLIQLKRADSFQYYKI